MHQVPSILNLSERLTALRVKLDIQPLEWAVHAPLLDDAQFTGDDVIAVTTLTASQLHNWVSRDWGFRLSQANPGKGKRRLYSGNDVIALNLAQELAPFGLVKVASQFIRHNHIAGRAAMLLTDPTVQPGFGYFISRDATAPTDDDTAWAYTPFSSPDVAKLGRAVVALDVDGLIIETLERLALVVAGESVPAKDRLILPTAEETAKEVEDFFGVRDTDESGRKVLTGLTFEQSAEYEALDALHRHDRSHEQSERWLELEDIHESARRHKVFAEMAAAREARERAE
jgi:hypothetical protein